MSPSTVSSRSRACSTRSYPARGEPANADFMLWLSTDREDYLLVQEYAFDMPQTVADFTDQNAHLEELTRHRRLIDSRSSLCPDHGRGGRRSVCAVRRHQAASRCADARQQAVLQAVAQGCSYAENTATWLRNDGVLTNPCNVRALAITPNGLESLSARFLADNPDDPRRRLMEQMGLASSRRLASRRMATKLGRRDQVSRCVPKHAAATSRKLEAWPEGSDTRPRRPARTIDSSSSRRWTASPTRRTATNSPTR
ncbi:MAG: hypothetical protein MZV65_44320 [Chromatiales bacterium]|nr:hypothetical protein [Chromatiales bacterium]